jgi:uncharacterized protein
MNAPSPDLVSVADASAVELQPDGPVDVVRGTPMASVRELYHDQVVECGVWEVTPGEFAGENAGFGEHMYILCGDATVTSEDGSTVELGPGVSFVARPGWRGRWVVRDTVRKIFVIWRLPEQ